MERTFSTGSTDGMEKARILVWAEVSFVGAMIGRKNKFLSREVMNDHLHAASMEFHGIMNLHVKENAPNTYASGVLF